MNREDKILLAVESLSQGIRATESVTLRALEVFNRDHKNHMDMNDRRRFKMELTKETVASLFLASDLEERRDLIETFLTGSSSAWMF